MKLNIRKGATSKTLQFFVNDSSVTNGNGLAGLSSGSGSLTAYYYREGDSVTASIPLTNTSLGLWVSGGIATVDATNMPGLYQIGVPNAALATGASSVVLFLRGATNMAPLLMEAQLVDFNPDDSVRMGLTALPNAAAGANGGLPTGDASGRVTVGSMTADVITASVIADNAIDAGAIAANAITSAKIAADAIGASQIAADAIGASELAQGAIDEIWAKALTELSAVPGVTGTILDAMNWVFTLSRNKRIQTATQETVFKDDGSSSLAGSTKSDDGVTFTRGEYS